MYNTPSPLPKSNQVSGEYIWVPSDYRYGPLKLVFIPHTHGVRVPPSSKLIPTPEKIQDSPPPQENRIDALRAKWKKDWEERKRNPKKYVDNAESCPSNSGSLTQESQSADHSANASPSSSYSAQPGWEPRTPPRQEWSSEHSLTSDPTKYKLPKWFSPSPLKVSSDLSPLAEPFIPSTPEL